MCKNVASMIVLFLVLAGCSKEGEQPEEPIYQSTQTSSMDQEPIEEPVLLLTEAYETRVFGDEGPLLYIFGWDHDGGIKLERSKIQLLNIFSSLDSPRVNMVIEGFFPPGVKVEFGYDINHQIRDLLDAATMEGAQLWAGEKETTLFETVRLNRITLNPKGLSKDEACMHLLAFILVQMKRTEIMLETSLAKKRSSPETTVIGCMGDGHFDPYKHVYFRDWARKRGVRIVLYATTKMLAKDASKPELWNDAYCGPWQDARQKADRAALEIVQIPGFTPAQLW